LDTALAGLRSAEERTADSVAVLLRAALLDLPAGGLAPMLRRLAGVLSERLESKEKARSKRSTLHTEAAVLALSPIAILLLIGAVSPGYLAAYRTVGGTIVLITGGMLIWGCYLMMRRLGRVPEPRRTGERP
jgi:tight adherence protein B